MQLSRANYKTKRTHVAIWKWVQKFSILAERFVVGKRKAHDIFVDETLLKINGRDYWLWIAYEPNLHICLMFHLSREKNHLFCMLSVFQTDKNKIWKKTNLH
ncbi:MAG: hypothetical protein ACR2IS_17885, partial [Nitrososphaeraceae archaeon]